MILIRNLEILTEYHFSIRKVRSPLPEGKRKIASSLPSGAVYVLAKMIKCLKNYRTHKLFSLDLCVVNNLLYNNDHKKF